MKTTSRSFRLGPKSTLKIQHHGAGVLSPTAFRAVLGKSWGQLLHFMIGEKIQYVSDACLHHRQGGEPHMYTT